MGGLYQRILKLSCIGALRKCRSAIIASMKTPIPRFLPLFNLVVLLLVLPLGETRALLYPPVGDADYYASSLAIFLPDELAVVDVTMSQAALDSLLADPWSDEYRRCSVRFRNSVIDEVVDNVGIRVRGNTSRAAIKKSWKLSFNTFVPDRKFHGLEKMNLNGEHNDPSIIRSSLAMDLYRKTQTASSRTHHVLLKINDGSQVDGVQIHVEQIDEEFVQAWFANKDSSLYKCLFKGARANLNWVWPGDGDAYKNLGGGETYEEKNLDSPNYADLAEFIDFINQSSDALFADELGKRFSLDNFLRAMATDVAVGNWDNYWFGANNYYLFFNADSGRFEYIPYDVDNTFGVDFLGTNWATRPWLTWGDGGYGSEGGELPSLIRRILLHEPYRNQIRRYLRELVEGPFFLPAMENRIDQVKELIGPFAFAGSYDDGNMDWGYTREMFHESYTAPDAYRDWAWGWDYGLKPYILDRNSFLYGAVAPVDPLPKIRINELQSSNNATIADEWGDFDDWVEVINAGTVSLQLGGLFLSDTVSNPTRFEFPDTILAPGSFLLIWCDSEPEEGPWHSEFSLSSAGEQLGLFHRSSEGMAPLDTLRFGPIPSDWSRARIPDGLGDWEFTHHPTPGRGNETVAVPEGAGLEKALAIWPNPITENSEISFQMSIAGSAKLRVISPSGREVFNAEGEFPAGAGRFYWDGCDLRGRALPAGLYLIRIETGGRRANGKILILR